MTTKQWPLKSGSPAQTQLIKFASDLQLMKHRAVTLGLYETAQRMDLAVRMVGFEISGDTDSCRAYEAQQKDLTR
jgi:hypothetical protein